MTRRRYLAVTALAAIGIAAASAVETPLRLIWNATASAPVGFYTVEPADALDVSELVAVEPPEPLAAFMVRRGYVGRCVPLLKRVLGLPGQRVCRTGRTITVDGIEMVAARPDDTLDDLFPGTGAVAEAWRTWRLKFALPGEPAARAAPGGVQERPAEGAGS